MYKEERIILKYSIPDLGEYSIDEDMTIFRGKEKIVTCINLDDAKNNLSKIVISDREEKISTLRRVIRNLELQSKSLLSFRQKNTFL